MKVTVNGNATELITYRRKDTRNLSDGVATLEIYYDPSVGYLPRYSRINGPLPDGDQAFKEFYLLEARPCASGGFVPAEWYEASYFVSDFRRQYPSYDYHAKVRPGFHRVAIGHFRATRISDRRTPVRLEKLTGITRISTSEKLAPIRSVPDRIGFDEIEAHLRRFPRSSALTGPAVDIDETRKYLKQPAPPNMGRIVGLAAFLFVATAGIFLLVRRRRSLVLLAIGLSTALTGCDRSQGVDRARLVAEVSPPFLVHDPDVGILNLSLVVRNEGGGRIRVFQASGGCSCRRIDQSGLPVELTQGRKVILKAKIRSERAYDPRGFVLALSTDRGILDLPVKYHAVPTHDLFPASINLGAIIDGSHTEGGVQAGTVFEVVHREIVDGSKSRAPVSIVVPPDLIIQKRESRQVEVPGQPDFRLVDTTYALSLVDPGYGLKKTVVTLQGDGGGILCETPVIWQRLPYLSSNPAKLYLGSRPVRYKGSRHLITSQVGQAFPA